MLFDRSDASVSESPIQKIEMNKKSMSDGASKDYDNPQKNMWVRSFWNQVLRKTKGREQSEVVLYLAGPDDFDRHVAIQRGVPSQNLIAIDRNRNNIQSVRESGNAGICADVMDVLTTWPRSTPVCAIVLDFCQGFQRLGELRRMMEVQMSNPALSRAVIAINMQRGRDHESNTERSVISGFVEKWRSGVNNDGSPQSKSAQKFCDLIRDHSPIHRGLIFAIWYWAESVKRLSACSMWRSLPPGSEFVLFTEQFRPRMLTYKTPTGLVFDSVVIYPCSEFLALDPTDASNRQIRTKIKSRGKRKVALSTAATLAVRTRRMNEAGA